MSKTWWWVLGSLLVIFVGLEVGVRLVLPVQSYEEWRRSSLRYVYDKHYHWSLRPGSYRAPHGEIRVNSLGLRGDEVEVPKPAGVTRILALGGSSTFSYRTREDETWPRRLAALLSEWKGGAVEVINCGTPGYSTYQSGQRLEHQVGALSPDFVLVDHLWNDLKLFWRDDRDSILSQWDRHGRKVSVSTLLDPLPVLDRLSGVSQAITYGRFAYINFLKKRRNLSDEGWVHDQLDKSIAPEGIAFFRSNMTRLADVCDSLCVPLGIIEQPLLVSRSSTEEAKARIRYDYLGFDHTTLLEAMDTSHQNCREVSRRPGAHYLETSGTAGAAQNFSDHVHLTSEGHARLAAELAAQIGPLLFPNHPN